MSVLLDGQIPHKLRPDIAGHDVFTVRSMGWDGIRNGALPRLVEGHFDVSIAADRKLADQQNVQGRSFAVIVLVVPNTQVGTLRPLVPEIPATAPTTRAGEVVGIEATPPM